MIGQYQSSLLLAAEQYLSDLVNDVFHMESKNSVSRRVAGEHPPTNPLVVLKAARWGYTHGNGGTNRTFR
ncbi:MAG: hypothetical protein ACI9PP_000279 [Halobacteriales archaeon]|jgi:hypothetical protein